MNFEEELYGYYDLTQEKADAFLAEVLNFANSDKARFLSLVDSVRKDDSEFLRVIYEALGKDPANWEDFFLRELNSFFARAKNTTDENEQKTILMDLEGISVLDKAKISNRQKIVQTLLYELESDKPALRYYSMDLLFDFINVSDSAAVARVHELLTDPIWRIRYWTWVNLKGEGYLAEGNDLSLTDKVRAKLTNTRF